MKYTVRMDSRTRKTLDRLPGDVHGRVMRTDAKKVILAGDTHVR